MTARLKYWLYLCDEWALHLLIGEDVIDREINAERVRAAFATDDHRRRTP